MEKYDVRDITRWILKKEPVTHKRLQKYLYFFYGEFLANRNSCVNKIDVELFKNDFQGWAHGPVSPTIYDIFKGSSYHPLLSRSEIKLDICTEDEELLNKIYNKYRVYSTDRLEELSHEQEPWKNSRDGLGIFDIGTKPILTADIFNCFSSNGSKISS